MDCCQCQGIETKFDQTYVAKKIERYRKEGPRKTTLQLIDALRAESVEGMSLLDIGGGVGGIQHALLASGVTHAHNVEASTAYVEACKAEAQRQGHADRVRHVQGNFVDVADDVDAADIVTLDRVICCYHDMPRLVGLSARKAKKLYGVVYPRDTWWVWLGNEVYYNGRHRLKGNPMRNYIYPTAAVEAVVRESGLQRRFLRHMGGWQIAVFGRP